MCYFFFSCAGDDIDESLIGFFEDLAKEVADLLGIDKESAGFIFRQEKSVGTDWPTSAGGALARCKVFVPVYTSRFMASSNCGREYYAFRQRLVHARLPWERIVPIWWIPPNDGLPPAIQDIVDPRRLMMFEHEKFGLRLVFKERGNAASPYPKLLAMLAYMIVQRGGAEPQLVPGDIPDLANGLSIFDQVPKDTSAVRRPSAPKRVNFLVVSGTRDEMSGVPGRKYTHFYGDSRDLWNPFHPNTFRPLGIEACEVAGQSPDQIFSMACAVPGDLNLFIKRKEHDREMVVLLVDSWAIHIDSLSGLLAEYDTHRYFNSAVIVPFAEDDGETAELEAALRDKLWDTIRRTMSGEGNCYREDADSLADFKVVVAEVLHKLVASLVMDAPPPRQGIRGARGIMPVLAPPEYA